MVSMVCRIIHHEQNMTYGIIDIGTGFLADIRANLLGVLCTWELLTCLFGVDWSERRELAQCPGNSIGLGNLSDRARTSHLVLCC